MANTYLQTFGKREVTVRNQPKPAIEPVASSDCSWPIAGFEFIRALHIPVTF